MTPYPFIFCPPNVAKPKCCPHMGAVKQTAAGGPEGTGGLCWGGPYMPDAGEWIKVPSGWYVGLNGHKPQDTVRLDPHPRIVKWISVPGVMEDHHWRVPVLLTRDPQEPEAGFISAIDRLWDGSEWSASKDLQALQEPLLAIANGVPLAMDLEERNRACIDLAVGILQVAHWVDSELIAATQWMSEMLVAKVIHAACDIAKADEVMS